MDLHGLIDYHLHTAVTVDALATEDEYCQRAIRLGLQEIAFTNHFMLGNPDYCISPQSMRDHWQQIQACQQRYPQLTIRMGLELDYFEGQEDKISAIIEDYQEIAGRPFDFVIGAVHYLRGIFFSSKLHAPDLFSPLGISALSRDGRQVETLYHEYFTQMTQAVRSGFFDVMAHPDLIKKHTGQLSPRVPFERYRAEVEVFVRALVESDVGIEINTKGLTLNVAEIFPAQQLLSLYMAEIQQRGVEPVITIGSDAHRAEEMGAHHAEGIEALQRAGCFSLTTFECRERSTIQIEKVSYA